MLSRVSGHWRKTCALVIALAIGEALFPVLLHDEPRYWLVYIPYVALGVVAPGLLTIRAFVSWRADWLTWVGLGWAVGHVLEEAALLGARVAGVPKLFLIWIPVAYLLALRKARWAGVVIPLPNPRRSLSLLAVAITLATVVFVALNLNELSPRPVYQSDIWFHINEAHEWRDHLDSMDPRISGRPFAYHMLAYGPSVGANLATGVPLANLITRYAGLSGVWLLVLLLFNTGRVLGGPLSGFFAALLITLPIDVMSLISDKLSFGSSLLLFGVDVSTTTLVGLIAVTALLLPLHWLLGGGRVGDAWVIAGFAYLAAGAKSVPGPLLVAGSCALIASYVIAGSRPPRRAVLTGLICTAAAALTTLPLLMHSTEAGATRLVLGSAARQAPYAAQMSVIPEVIRLAVWPLGFCLLIWVGAGLAVARLRTDPSRRFAWFVGGVFVSSVMVSSVTFIRGESQLFFLYIGMAAIAPLAGVGLQRAAAALWRGRLRAASILLMGAAACAAVSSFAIGGHPSPPLYDGSVWAQELFANHVEAGIAVYTNPSSVPTATPSGYEDRGLVSQRLRMTPAMAAGLRWARESLGPDSVIATNVPGAAVYSALCERREFYQTPIFAPEYYSSPADFDRLFGWRERLLRAWMAGAANSVDDLRKAGVNYLIVDRVNGLPVAAQRDMGLPVFAGDGFEIFKIA